MSTPYSNIYTRAIGLFEDPRLTSAFESSPLDFFQTMYSYLNNAIPSFISPSGMQTILNNRVKPEEGMEIFDGNGITQTFLLSATPPSGSIFSYMVDNEYVSASYSQLTNSVTFDVVPAAGSDNVSVEWYLDGYFNQTLNDRQELILAMFTVVCWLEKEKNFWADIRRILKDTDFKLADESNTMRGKMNLFDGGRERAIKEMKNYSWDNTKNYLTNKYNLSTPTVGV